MVDHAGAVVLESFVHIHPANITDWRTDTSGIRPGDLDGAPTFEQVQARVKALVKDKIIVGHAVFNDLSVEDARAAMQLFLSVREAYETSLLREEDVVAGIPPSFAQWYW
ncbi:hypothetical protein P7C73_g1899, partial [Tremellales sp. Uapishka_1]